MSNSNLSLFIAAFSRLGEEAQIEAGNLLWQQGDTGDHVCLLLDGSVDVTHRTPEGQDIPIRTMGAGAVVGEIAVLDGRSRSATIRARTPCRVIRVLARDFQDLLRRFPDVVDQILSVEAGRIRDLTERLKAAGGPEPVEAGTRLCTSAFFRWRLHTEIRRARAMGDALSILLFEVGGPATGPEEDTRPFERLAPLAERVRGVLSRGDLLGYLGEGRLGVLAYGAGTADGADLLERARREVRSRGLPATTGGDPTPVQAKVGLATFPIDAQDEDGLLAAAEKKLRGDG
ncbi:MAG: cyclic nucleotide-binding domain-containing protein [Planctomycetes bacterium]|nr:cyclic nucleotide-binding domain-containing protein [Planctomycetota bacterium]